MISAGMAWRQLMTYWLMSRIVVFVSMPCKVSAEPLEVAPTAEHGAS